MLSVVSEQFYFASGRDSLQQTKDDTDNFLVDIVLPRWVLWWLSSILLSWSRTLDLQMAPDERRGRPVLPVMYANIHLADRAGRNARSGTGERLRLPFDPAAGLDDDVVRVQQPLDGFQVEHEMSLGQLLFHFLDCGQFDPCQVLFLGARATQKAGPVRTHQLPARARQW